jgi:hypothetical protein
MRRLGLNVKPLARCRCIWHRVAMAKDAADKERIKAERLREALRANLRRRKAPVRKYPAEPDESAEQG